MSRIIHEQATSRLIDATWLVVPISQQKNVYQRADLVKKAHKMGPARCSEYLRSPTPFQHLARRDTRPLHGRQTYPCLSHQTDSLEVAWSFMVNRGCVPGDSQN